MVKRGWLNAVVVAILVAAALAGCGSSGSTPTVSSDDVTLAAYRSTHGPGFKFTLDMKVSAEGEDVLISGDGVIDERQLRGTMSMHAAGTTIREIIDNPYVYIQVPGDSGDDGEWQRARMDVYTAAASGSGAATSDPAHTLDLLRASGDVERVGTDTVRGQPSVHYRAIVKLDQIGKTGTSAARDAAQRNAAMLKRVTGSDTLPMDVYINKQGRVSRLAFDLDVCTEGATASLSLTMDMYDYGRQDIGDLPAPDKVKDITDELRDKAGEQLDQPGC
jgi:hypothetical protein